MHLVQEGKFRVKFSISVSADMKIVFLVNSGVLAEIHKEITKKTYFLCRPIPEIIKKPIFQIGQYQYWIFFLWINSPESGK